MRQRVIVQVVGMGQTIAGRQPVKVWDTFSVDKPKGGETSHVELRQLVCM
jgi:hypothetical protein